MRTKRMSRDRRKLKYRGGGKNDKLICHIIKLIESIPKEDSSTPRPRVTSTGRAFLLEHSKKARQAAIRQDEILWKEAGVNKLRDFGRLWADKFWSVLCKDKDEYKNRKPPRPP